MISVTEYLKNGFSPLQNSWNHEHTKENIRNNTHNFDFNLFPEDEKGLAELLHDKILRDAFKFRNKNRPPSRAPAHKLTTKFSNKIFDLCLLMIGNGFLAIDKKQVIRISISSRQEVTQLIKFHREEVKAAIEAMEKNGFFEVLIGGSNCYDGDFVRTATRLIPLNKFMELRNQVITLREDATRKKVVKLRLTEKKRMYENGRWTTKKLKKDLKISGDYSALENRIIEINTFNNKFTLKGVNVNENGIIGVPCSNRKVSVNLNCYTAIHTNDMAHGGRLFAMQGVQSLPKSERVKLSWEGFSDGVVELDFSGMHPSFLAALEGEEMTRYAYDVGDVLNVGREAAVSIAKLVYNTCLNSSSKRQSTGAIRGRVQDDLGIHLTAKDVEKVRKSIMKAFPWVKKYFYTGYGLKLMKLERDIALHVIESMHAKSVPCLTMHDSFLVPAEHRDELAYFMKYWASHVTGTVAGRDVGFDHFKVK